MATKKSTRPVISSDQASDLQIELDDVLGAIHFAHDAILNVRPLVARTSSDGDVEEIDAAHGVLSLARSRLYSMRGTLEEIEKTARKAEEVRHG